ncbi:60S ribosomal protein L7/L12 family member protein [Theileria equi strain WA]|uniref:60S ribosomal protein L7/L12 family member protein n=1 Tax=Theileria equi strain WA TaxID=1537102 RepID=L0AY62_THEEQ|nr:60S ribosomal protein L7/L12 family member protein [Theileria equi strain WA]AFZ79844.1 60S ribosomal protein L7/L12 family member protein [Theileria equi strain WA]|eukprot:XP_004829510.1 60S ribosomal protein L7/L12 family member protein [Theileria equi strain WA]
MEYYHGSILRKGSITNVVGEPQKTTCTIKLVGFDASKKIAVIKVVRSICGLGLRESKELVESFPRAIKKDVPREEAEKFAKEIQEAGGTVDLE